MTMASEKAGAAVAVSARSNPSGATQLSLSEQLAAWYEGLRYEDLPDDIIVNTRLRILDVIGLSITGSQLEYGPMAHKAALDIGGKPEAHIIGYGDHIGAPSAAMANGLMAHCLEFDDTHNETLVHASVTSATAALAAGELAGTNGKDIVTAVAGANEIACRLGSVTPGQLHINGFHATGVVGAFSAAYLACRLFGLNAALMRHAVGIAGSMTSGSLECWSDNTHAKALHPGWAAHGGIIATYLARAGLTGPKSVFEGRWGFFRSHVQQTGYHYQFERLTRGLGSEWESRNLSFKPFPVGHVSHPYISAILRMHAQGLRADEVDYIVCKLNAHWIPIVAEPLHEKLKPETAWHGRVSLQYTLAEALFTGRIDVRSYGPENLHNPEVLALAAKIKCEVDPNAPGREQFKGWVIAHTKDGRRLEEIEEYNRGSRQNPMTRDEIVGKFRANAGFLLSNDTIEKIIEAAENIETLRSISDLVTLTIGRGAQRV
jgi:2-methylcitrate dehydratase PrpD